MRFSGIQQAIFNYLIYNDLVKVPFTIKPNLEGPVVTLADPKVFTHTAISGNHIVRAKDGSIIPVVHMYDRFPELNALYTNRKITE